MVEMFDGKGEVWIGTDEGKGKSFTGIRIMHTTAGVSSDCTVSMRICSTDEAMEFADTGLLPLDLGSHQGSLNWDDVYLSDRTNPAPDIDRCYYCGKIYHDDAFHKGSCAECGGPK
jgi:hypothetical protein